MELMTLQNRVVFLAGQFEEAKRVYEEALKEGQSAAKQQNPKSTTVDTGNTEILNSDKANESK